MSKKLITISALTLALLTSACFGGPSATNSVSKGKERSSGLFGMSKADAVSVDNKEAFKAVDKVVIGSFKIGFATYKTDSAKAGGGLSGGFGGKSTAKSTLVGVDDKTMQSITDQAYQQFVSDLKAKGYTIVDRKELLAHKTFADTKTYPTPYEDSTGGLFGSNSKTKYFSPSAFGDKMHIFMGEIGSTMGGFAFANPAVAAMEYARESGVKVLNVIYVVDYANAEGYGGWASTSSGVEIGQGITIVPEFSRLSLIGNSGGTFSNGNGSIKLGQPLSSEKEFATVKNVNSEAYKAAEVAVNVIGVLGGVGSNSSREYEFTARPADYKLAAAEVTKQANDTFVNTLAGLK
jgi:hypothetical protein